MLIVLAAGCWCWAGGGAVAEALNGWTARLALMTLADYSDPGDTHYSTY